jgi:hypothetical protein
VVEPSAPPAANPDKPQLEVELAWVHGYNAQIARKSLAYNARDEIVYPAASTCVVYDRRTHTQRFFRAHERELVSMAVAPNRRCVCVEPGPCRVFIGAV